MIFAGEALATLVVNKLRGIIKVCAIKAPGFGERRKALLQDIAIVTGAEYIAKDLGMRIEETQIEQLGTARKVALNPKSCCDEISQGAVRVCVTIPIILPPGEAVGGKNIHDEPKLILLSALYFF